MLDYKLTDAEICKAVGTVSNGGVPMTPSDWGMRFDRAIANAASDKALRAVVAWLRGDAAATFPPEWGEVVLDTAAILERIVGQGQR